MVAAWLAELDVLARRADALTNDTKRVVNATRAAIREARAQLAVLSSDSPLLVPDPGSSAAP